MNYIPVIGWLVSLFFNASLAVPFWFMWSYMNIGARYFYWLPEVYRSIPFLHCVALFTILSILKIVLVPKFAEVNQKVENKE